MEISRETFKESSVGAQNLILFDSINAIGQKLDAFNAGCDQKHDKIEGDIKRSGRINKGISAGTGLLGGFIAVLMSKIGG